MRLKDGFITHESAGEHIMVPAGGVSFSGMVRSNRTAGYIVECLKEDTTQEAIVTKLLEKYDAPEEQVAKDVAMVIDKLRSIGAIEDSWI